MNIEEKKYKIDRYDLSEDQSLRPLSAADEYLLHAFNATENKPNHLGHHHSYPSQNKQLLEHTQMATQTN